MKHGRTIALAHLTQQVPPEDPDARVLPTIEDIRRVTRTVTGKDVSASSMLEQFGFTGDKLTARLGDLSGGERRRFQLLKLLLTEPNVLLLDEPTNDLDIDTLNVVEDFLDRWPGTLVVVSHDRYFLERVTDSIWALMGDGQISMLPNGVDQYLEHRRQGAKPATPTGPSAPEERSRGAAVAKGQGRRRGRAGRPQDRCPDRQAAQADRDPRGPADRGDVDPRGRPREARDALGRAACSVRGEGRARGRVARGGHAAGVAAYGLAQPNGAISCLSRAARWHAFVLGEVAEQLALAGQQALEGAVDGPLPGRGQVHEDAAPVARVG